MSSSNTASSLVRVSVSSGTRRADLGVPGGIPGTLLLQRPLEHAECAKPDESDGQDWNHYVAVLAHGVGHDTHIGDSVEKLAHDLRFLHRVGRANHHESDGLLYLLQFVQMMQLQ